jgi:phosphate:Na+ symporter
LDAELKELFIAISGVIFFLVGMIRLSSVVQGRVAARIKELARYAVDRPLYGLITGIVCAVAFQSSTAATVLTVGLVSAGLISFYSSLAIVLGADIGTALTVQLIVWRFTEISPLFIFTGGILWLAGKGKWETAGEMIFFFGLIFFGLDLVRQASVPLKESPAVLEFITRARNPLVGVGIGMAAAALAQASAVPIGILAVLAQQDLIPLASAVPMVLGANIGSTIAALLAGTVANVSGKRTAVSHLVFKCTGVLLCLIFLPVFIGTVERLSGSVAQQIALSHFLVNLVIVIVFIFILRPFSKLMKSLLPGEDEDLPVWPEYINRKDLADPVKALDHVSKELRRQMKLAEIMFQRATALMLCYRRGGERDISYVEMVVANLRGQIVKFLWLVSGGRLSTLLSRKIFAYTAMAGDIQSIGNHVAAIGILVAQQAQGGVKFSIYGEDDLREVLELVRANLTDASGLMDHFNVEKVKDVFRREEEVDVRVKEALENHLKRFHERQCTPQAGPIFVEMLGHLERISDLCNNIAEHIWDIQ